MIIKSHNHTNLIQFLLIFLQIFKTCLTLNVEFPEIDYLANNLTPNECFQLYNMFEYRHIRRGEILNSMQRRSQTIPCISLLSTWLTDPDELNNKTFDNVASKLTKIDRQDLALWLIRRKDKKNFKNERDKDMENEIVPESVIRDERLQRSICSKTSRKKTLFWKIFIVVLIVLILLLLLLCCCCCIYQKLRCTCDRNDVNLCGNKEEKEEEYCLCDEKLRASFDDYYTEKKKSYFKRVLSNFERYFQNRKEKNKEKLRYERFQRLKQKLQKMYEEKQKEIRVNRQEEKILNSLTEKERDELGGIICGMKFFLDSDKETERLLLSEKHSGTFIIDMKNLHNPKITRSHELSQEIKTIKKWKSGDRFSTSLSEEMICSCSQQKTSSESEILKYNREKKNLKKPYRQRKKHSNQHLKNENLVSKLTELKSEFIKCYATSESELNYSPVEQGSQRLLQESKCNSSFSSNDFSTFRSQDQTEKSQNSSLTQNSKEAQSKYKNSKRNSMKTESKTIIEPTKISSFSKETEPRKIEQNIGDYLNHEQNKPTNKNDKTNSNFNLKSSPSLNQTSSSKNLEIPIEPIKLFKNLDRGDTEFQLELSKTCDELVYLFSQHIKMQSQPCYRKYCLLRRTLKQSIHDLKNCRIKKNIQYYPQGQAPSCRTGNICRDTYDEFYLMRASPQERQIIRQTIYERRKQYLDQPCISPGRTNISKNVIHLKNAHHSSDKDCNAEKTVIK